MLISNNSRDTKSAFTCLKATLETLEQNVKSVQS